MRKLNLISGALGLAALALTACSNEAPVNLENGVAENDEVRYLRVAIANPPSTRATFEDGTDDENEVKSLYFLFYDINGNPIKTEELTMDDLTETKLSGNGNVGAIEEVVVKISINRGAQYPSYVVCFINPVDWSKVDDENAKMEELRNLERESYATDGFAMTNSVYFGNDPVSNANKVKMSGAPISASQLYTSEDAAKDKDAEAVTIYVERYAAKVNFSLAADAISPETVGNYTLEFVPETWSINAASKNMYAVKRYADSNVATTGIPTFDNVQAMLGTWDTWNDPDNYRSYWACSPSFYADKFPQVSDDIIDQAATGTGAGELVGDYKLLYYSYNQISGNNGYDGFGKGVGVASNGGSNTKYTLENTMGQQAFETLNPKAAAPSVVLVGHYDVKLDETTLPVGTGFCIYKSRLYFRSTPPAEAPGSQTILDAMLAQNVILASNQNGTAFVNAGASSTIKEYFEVVHPSKEVRNGQPVPHRYVTLQLKKDLASYTGLYYKPIGSATWNAVTANDVDVINTALWQQIGNASAYTNNKCYYSIPIQHLGISENTTAESPINADGTIDWTKVRVGDFGLVRNHVYTINVAAIGGRATGIEDLNNPLVPSMETNDYWIKYQVNILNWRVVPTQNVTVLK
ncbi:MAG: fimbria major subunit [Muribaculaceae bacterium]|nr:fimbria major subunit [Muribaculaceae bacterium]